MRSYCKLCGFSFESKDSANCPNCGSYHVIAGGRDIFER